MVRAALVGISFIAAAIPAQAQKVYSNPEYEIHLQVPRQVKLCSSPKNEHDHGFFLLLAGGPKDCHDDAFQRYIEVFASYNCTDDTKYLQGLLKMGCEAFGGPPCRPGPAGLSIPGLTSATAKVDIPNGWVQVVVAAQAGEPSPLAAGEPLINYLFNLRTRPEFLDQDLRLFQRVLETVKLGSGGEAR
jgi:hypothetical protein